MSLLAFTSVRKEIFDCYWFEVTTVKPDELRERVHCNMMQFLFTLINIHCKLHDLNVLYNVLRISLHKHACHKSYFHIFLDSLITKDEFMNTLIH